MRLYRICVILLACWLPASAILAQASSQHDCRKEPAGGLPDWLNTSKSKNKMKTLVWTGGSWSADHVKTYCFLLIQVCGTTVVNRLKEDESTEVAPGTHCPSSGDYAAPWVDCDVWNKALKKKCGTRKIESLYGCTPFNSEFNGNDPLNVNPGKPQGNRGLLYINVDHARTYRDPSTDSPVLRGVFPRGSRAAFTDVKDVSGTIWYHVASAPFTGWMPGDEISCSQPPVEPVDRKVTLKELNLLDGHPLASLTSAGNG